MKKQMITILSVLLLCAGCEQKTAVPSEQETQNPIFHRTSVRSFESREVEDEKIRHVPRFSW